MNSRQFFDNYWSTRDQRANFRHKNSFEIAKGLCKSPVLDFGCGDGIFMRILKNQGIEGVGLEISQSAVDKAKAKGLDARFFGLEEKTLPFADNFFHSVFMLDVVGHMYKPEEIMKEISRVCKKYLFISSTNFNGLPSRLQMLAGKMPEIAKHKRAHVYWVNYKILKKLLNNNGFQIIQMRTNSFFTWFPVVRNLTQALSRIWPSLFALNFLFVAEKKVM